QTVTDLAGHVHLDALVKVKSPLPPLPLVKHGIVIAVVLAHDGDVGTPSWNDVNRIAAEQPFERFALDVDGGNKAVTSRGLHFAVRQGTPVIAFQQGVLVAAKFANGQILGGTVQALAHSFPNDVLLSF